MILSLADQLRQLTDAELDELFRGVPASQLAALRWCWREVWARPDEREAGAFHLGRGQLPPDGIPWTWWANIGGRASGKTRSCAEWVSEQALRQGAGFVVHLVSQTPEDGADAMISGVSGLETCSPPWAGFKFTRSREGGVLEWKNGARGRLFGATTPRKGRGPACCAMWLDDPAAYGRNGLETFRQLLFGFRERMPDGSEPRGVISSTPIDSELLDEILAGEDGSRGATIVYSASATDDNRTNLAETLFTGHLARIVGGADEQRERFGRRPPKSDGSPFKNTPFALLRLLTFSPTEIAVSIDPATSSASTSCKVGIEAVGIDEHATVCGLLSRSAILDAGPAGWPRVAWDLFDLLRSIYPAARIRFVIEINKGGNMGPGLLRAEERVRRLERGERGVSQVEIREKTARVSKTKRGAPVAALAPAQLRFLPGLETLELELRGLSDDEHAKTDAADAFVWGALDLAGLGEADVRWDVGEVAAVIKQPVVDAYDYSPREDDRDALRY